jgi:hypothetical protein
MTVRIYTWPSGDTNVLCDACADQMFFILYQRIYNKYPGLSQDEFKKLDSTQELIAMDAHGVPSLFECKPIVTNKYTGLPMCLSDISEQTTF